MRKYSVQEIDELRQACDHIYVWGTPLPLPSGGLSRCYDPKEKAVKVEEMIRTYMTAGITAKDLYEEYKSRQVQK